MNIIHKIKKQTVILIILNFVDGIATYVGVNKGYAIEINPIMQNIVESPLKLLFIKILFPTFLLILLSKRIKKEKQKKIEFTIISLNILILMYIVLVMFHTIWIYLIVKYSL